MRKMLGGAKISQSLMTGTSSYWIIMPAHGSVAALHFNIVDPLGSCWCSRECCSCNHLVFLKCQDVAIFQDV
jgi:hypothetical protein